jgi:hypothetical protein
MIQCLHDGILQFNRNARLPFFAITFTFSCLIFLNFSHIYFFEYCRPANLWLRPANFKQEPANFNQEPAKLINYPIRQLCARTQQWNVQSASMYFTQNSPADRDPPAPSSLSHHYISEEIEKGRGGGRPGPSEHSKQVH